MNHGPTPKALQLRDLRARACELRAQKLDYGQIGEILGVSAIRARDLVMQAKRERDGAALPSGLSRRAILALVVGRHGAIGGETIRSRFKRLAEIAAAYTWNELLAEEGVGKKTATEISRWLKSQGLSLRAPKIPVAIAVDAARMKLYPDTGGNAILPEGRRLRRRREGGRHGHKALSTGRARLTLAENG